MSHKIYAIIVTYNGSKWVDKCFGSLANSTIPLHILAIDNASTDGTPELIRQMYPQVELIETGENLGFGKANNIGLKRVLDDNADYAFLLNQDAWVENDTIEKLICLQHENTQFDIISPIHLNGKGDAIDYNFQTYLNHVATPNFYSDIYLNKTKKLYESKFVNAAAWLLTNKCISIVGGFDPTFKHYGEDDDYINRLHEKSLKLAVATHIVILHDRPQKGTLGKQFYVNKALNNALIAMKKESQPNIFFQIRKIIAYYITLYFAHMGKNDQIRYNLKQEIYALKYRKQTKKHYLQQIENRAFL